MIWIEDECSEEKKAGKAKVVDGAALEWVLAQTSLMKPFVQSLEMRERPYV